MRSISEDSNRNPTFIGDARRQQLIESTIESVAEEGYAGASLAKVAKRAKISKSVVIYHFRDKDELLEQTVSRIYAEIWDFIQPSFEKETTANGQLRTLIELEFAYMTVNRNSLLAVAHILANHRDSNGTFYLRDQAEKSFLECVGAILEKGQKSGEFRAFAITPMATTLMHAINGALAQWVADPKLSLKAYERELVTLFELATRSQTSTEK